MDSSSNSRNDFWVSGVIFFPFCDFGIISANAPVSLWPSFWFALSKMLSKSRSVSWSLSTGELLPSGRHQPLPLEVAVISK